MSGEHNQLLAWPGDVRAFRHERRPGFAECAPSGRVRLDALACWLQDVAYADVEDAGLEHEAVWVVRRTRIRVNRFPRFGEHFRLTTFCSGLARMWAERRTDIVRVDGAGDAGGSGDGHGPADGTGPAGRDGRARSDVEAVSLWIHLDGERRHPSPLTEAEIRTYSGPGNARKVSARLHHPPPSALDGGSAWTFRATECDIADHINNAAYWEPLEEELLADTDPERLDAEIEYRAPAQPGSKRVLRAGDYRWIVGEDDEVHASMRLGHGDGR